MYKELQKRVRVNNVKEIIFIWRLRYRRNNLIFTLTCHVGFLRSCEAESTVGHIARITSGPKGDERERESEHSKSR